VNHLQSPQFSAINSLREYQDQEVRSHNTQFSLFLSHLQAEYKHERKFNPAVYAKHKRLIGYAESNGLLGLLINLHPPPNGATAPSGPGAHYLCFTIPLKHPTLARTPLDE